jgi:predicted membrane chloride channel (bestrophin family)
MARLRIDIKNRDLQRFKTVILSRYGVDEENPFTLDTNEQILDALTGIVKEYLTGLVSSHERHVKQQQAISGITVDNIDLNE